MKTRMMAGFLGAGLLLAPLTIAQEHPQGDQQQARSEQHKGDQQHARKSPQMDDDMRRAIAFEHYKDQAAARQARMEARGNAGRSQTNDHADRAKDPRKK